MDKVNLATNCIGKVSQQNLDATSKLELVPYRNKDYVNQDNVMVVAKGGPIAEVMHGLAEKYNFRVVELENPTGHYWIRDHLTKLAGQEIAMSGTKEFKQELFHANDQHLRKKVLLNNNELYYVLEFNLKKIKPVEQRVRSLISNKSDYKELNPNNQNLPIVNSSIMAEGGNSFIVTTDSGEDVMLVGELLICENVEVMANFPSTSRASNQEYGKKSSAKFDQATDLAVARATIKQKIAGEYGVAKNSNKTLVSIPQWAYHIDLQMGLLDNNTFILHSFTESQKFLAENAVTVKEEFAKIIKDELSYYQLPMNKNENNAVFSLAKTHKKKLKDAFKALVNEYGDKGLGEIVNLELSQSRLLNLGKVIFLKLQADPDADDFIDFMDCSLSEAEKAFVLSDDIVKLYSDGDLINLTAAEIFDDTVQLQKDLISAGYEKMVDKIEKKLLKHEMKVVKCAGTILLEEPNQGHLKGLIGLFTNGIAIQTMQENMAEKKLFITTASSLDCFNKYFANKLQEQNITSELIQLTNMNNEFTYRNSDKFIQQQAGGVRCLTNILDKEVVDKL